MRALLTFGVISLWSMAGNATVGPKQICSDLGTVIASTVISGSPSFTYIGKAREGWGVMSVEIYNTDANSSVTRFDMDCVTSADGFTTSLVPQSCATAAGVCTSTDQTWQKASPGSTNWPWRLDVEAFRDVKCTLSIGAGTSVAADVVYATARLCTKGS